MAKIFQNEGVSTRPAPYLLPAVTALARPVPALAPCPLSPRARSRPVPALAPSAWMCHRCSWGQHHGISTQ